MIVSIESKTWPASARAVEILKNKIAIDMIASPSGTGWTEPDQIHDYFERARGKGITGCQITIGVGGMNMQQFFTELKVWKRALYERPGAYRVCHSVDDIRRAHREGETAIIWMNQTVEPLDGSPENMLLLRELGISSMLLAYNDRYRAGDGCIVPLNEPDGGLSSYGADVVRAMHRYGVVLDLSHCSPRTCKEAAALTVAEFPETPWVYTHSLPQGVHPECYRNISDEQIQACAEAGGVVCPTFTGWMMDPVFPEQVAPEHCVAVLDYVAKLVGVDHVGIASDDMFTVGLVADFTVAHPELYNDGGWMNEAFAKGATSCGEMSKILPAVVDGLLEKGYSEDDIGKIVGGNMMRVFEKVWR